MPRININEKDRTSPGTPGGYSNNTVLIAGFSAYTEEEIKANAEAVQADDNGIFEFESADDFEKTIGLVAPNEIEIPGEAEANRTARLPEHYGNQMAYELLSMGYMVIYINLGVPYTKDATGAITIDAAEKMSKLGEFDDTWAIFKDKASYDFRFVSHGLLTSDEYAKSDNLVKLEKRVAKMRTFLPVFNGETDIQNKKDDKGKDIVDATTKEPVKETVIEAKERIYQAAVAKESAFLTSADTKAEREAIGYTSSILTIVTLGASAGYDQANINIKALEDEIKGLLEADAVNNFSPEDFNEANAAIAKLAHYRAVTASDGLSISLGGTLCTSSSVFFLLIPLFIIPLFSLFINVHVCAKSLQSSPTLRPHGL